MRPERPAIVGSGASGVTIFHWRVPLRLGGEQHAIRGGLDWLPDPVAVRDQRAATDDPLLTAGVLGLAGLLGAGAGVALRRRHPRSPDPA